MYTPAHFANQNKEELLDFVRSNSFGVIVSSGELIGASHLPLDLTQDGTKLSGHFSKANPQGKSLRNGDDVLCIFNGPHAYISSSWYDHENVPTWNYIAVLVRGKINLIQGEALYKRLSDMVDKYETSSANPVSLKGMSPDYVDKHMRGIIGFDVEINSIEGVYKLSQNRDKKNYESIITELERRDDVQSKAIAAEMRTKNIK